MHQTIKPIKEIEGLTTDEKRLLSAWRESYQRHIKNGSNGRNRLMMYVELTPIGGKMSVLRCHNISRHIICGEPVD